jgi:PTS system cellobiose-specific IIB component
MDMDSYKILLVCSGGMSTSALMKKMETYASSKNIELKIDACGTGGYKDRYQNFDVILLGPQVAYRKADIAKNVNVPVAVISPQDYAFGNCENIFKEVDSILDH